VRGERELYEHLFEFLFFDSCNEVIGVRQSFDFIFHLINFRFGVSFGLLIEIVSNGKSSSIAILRFSPCFGTICAIFLPTVDVRLSISIWTR
jgi:hypothetical protein